MHHCLSGKDNLFVIACNKCFKEFDTVDEPDCDEFLKFAAEQGKTVTGSTKVDFLCNKMHTERKLQDLFPEGTENVSRNFLRPWYSDSCRSGRKTGYMQQAILLTTEVIMAWHLPRRAVMHVHSVI